MKVLNGHTSNVASVAFSPDGTRIVSGSSDESVRVWVASTGAKLKVLNGHTSYVSSVAFSPDGMRIVSGSSDESVRVWDASTGAKLKVFNGHTSFVFSVAFSPDGTRIVSGSTDKSVRVWDASIGAELKVLNGHTSTIRSVAFSPDGAHVVFGSHDKSVRVCNDYILRLAGRLMRLKDVVANKADKSIQTGDVHMNVNQVRTMQNISLMLLLKVYADAEVQAQLDPQLQSNTSLALSSLLTILREKKVHKQAEWHILLAKLDKPGSSIGCVVNVVTIDLARSILTTKNYVNTALQLSGESDTELFLDFMLYLLCGSHLSCSEVPDANRRARRLMLKMITKTPVAPSSLFVKGITAKVDYDYVGRGGFGFVFKGELRGAAVALKLLYKTRHHDASRWLIFNGYQLLIAA